MATRLAGLVFSKADQLPNCNLQAPPCFCWIGRQLYRVIPRCFLQKPPPIHQFLTTQKNELLIFFHPKLVPRKRTVKKDFIKNFQIKKLLVRVDLFFCCSLPPPTFSSDECFFPNRPFNNSRIKRHLFWKINVFLF